MREWIAGTLLLLGGVIILIAGIGVLRLPDFFMRMHAATKAGAAGSGFILLGVAALHPEAGTLIKAAVAILFLLLTTPIASHLLARAGYVGGVSLWDGTVEDRLEETLSRGRFNEARLPGQKASRPRQP
ncbi:MAG: monovalent cation/H(+) antiporter subunit G [Gemmatimonadales bacterium]